MQKVSFLLTFTLAFFNLLMAQNPFVGTFNGAYNGDNIILTLQNPNSNILNGKMTDSQQNYEVTATSHNNQIQGKAVEKTLNLTFVLNGNLAGNQLNMQMTLELNGQKQVLDVVFVKQGSGAGGLTNATKSQTANSKVTLPKGATHDPNLVGTWAKNETYNSGYGDNYT